MKEKETGSGHMKATASNIFLLLRCTASDHTLAWLIDGQVHCNADWRSRHILHSDASELDLKHSSWCAEPHRKLARQSSVWNMHDIDLTFCITKCNRKVTWQGTNSLINIRINIQFRTILSPHLLKHTTLKSMLLLVRNSHSELYRERTEAENVRKEVERRMDRFSAECLMFCSYTHSLENTSLYFILQHTIVLGCTSQQTQSQELSNESFIQCVVPNLNF
jgi:hypothetical protein